jgi:oligoribonuclease NrnB/cAMP/cGMP phosphodiesterase (DHH superfamily)
MIIENKFPNVIIFHHNDADGICAAFVIKNKFDNNLANHNWDRNVTCIPCSYGEKYSLDFFKEKVEENYIEGMQNLVYMVDYAIQPNNLMLNFWNWLSDKGCQFTWIDHHITAIEQLKHLNIPGFQHSAKSGCLNTWFEIMKDTTGISSAPMVLRFVNDFDIWNKRSEYSWDKQLYPLIYFINSLGSDLNDNTGELVTTLKQMFEDNNYTNKCINIGKYIYRYIQNEYNINANKIYDGTWKDYKCLFVNSSYKGSTQFECLENYKDYDLLIAWNFNGKKYLYGVYSVNPKIHCGELCKMYLNGGGHKGAGGGESTKFLTEE